MPGYNQKGPLGEGKMTGRQRGMCRRTEDQTFKDIRGGRGTGGMQDLVRRSGTQDENDSNLESGFYDDLKSLKEQYRDTQTMLSTIEKKIKALESRE
jgi:hypothetical protein